ncbi:MAG: hypothetical protein Q9172_001103 [Xanthocarpia lactea]
MTTGGFSSLQPNFFTSAVESTHERACPNDADSNIRGLLPEEAVCHHRRMTRLASYQLSTEQSSQKWMSLVRLNTTSVFMPHRYQIVHAHFSLLASTITVVKTAWALALNTKQLIESIKTQDHKAKELVDKFGTLTTVLSQAAEEYGQDESRSYTSREQQIRQNIIKIVAGCNEDLDRFQPTLKKLVSPGNWASVAWKQQSGAPALAKIEKSLSERQQVLQVQVQALHSLKFEQLHEMLRPLINEHPDDIPPTTILGDSVRTTTPNGEAQSAESEIDRNDEANGTLVGENEPASHQDMECRRNGTLLLETIDKGQHDRFQILLLDRSTSLEVTDAKERTPLLLAAHLDKTSMVKMLLSDVASSSSSEIHTNPIDTGATRHREVDFNATDRLGRSVLHYCAEFGMYDEANILLDRGVDVNARDNSGYPPAYYAIKYRNYYITKLLLDKGATTDFEQPTPPSHEIKELLQKVSSKE